jgi:FkbM family methyltransferase
VPGQHEAMRREMYRLAKSPIAPLLGQRVPLRGPARLLHRSYAKTRCHPGDTVKRLTSREGDTFEADLSSFLEWHLWAFGSYEEHFAELFRHLVRSGDRCVDVGANVGIHTVRLAKLAGPAGEVVAVEPNDEVARRAEANLALNHLRNVRVINAAAADRAGGSVVLYRPGARDTNKGRASMLPHAYLTGPESKVDTVTVDEIAGGPVALIKIDVEGCEADVVAGAAATIAACSPAVIIEYAPELMQSTAPSPWEWLSGRGYELFRICPERHRLTGRMGLALAPVRALPPPAGDVLAIPAARTAGVRALVR